MTPTELDCFAGVSNENAVTEEQVFVVKQGYRLSEVKMWKNLYNVSGFRLTFIPIIPEASGWNPVSFIFGYTDQTSELETIEIDYNLAKIGICIDDAH